MTEEPTKYRAKDLRGFLSTRGRDIWLEPNNLVVSRSLCGIGETIKTQYESVESVAVQTGLFGRRRFVIKLLGKRMTRIYLFSKYDAERFGQALDERLGDSKMIA